MIFCNWGIHPVQTDGHEKIHSTIVSDGYSDYKQSLTTNIISAFAFSVPPVHICACDSVRVCVTVLLVKTCLLVWFWGQVFICFVGVF